MAGFTVLAPLIARGLGPVVSPLFHALGVDPVDPGRDAAGQRLRGAPSGPGAGRYREAGLFSGLVVGSMLGTTVMLGIPTVMMFATQAERPAVIYGLLCGLVPSPWDAWRADLRPGFRQNWCSKTPCRC